MGEGSAGVVVGKKGGGSGVVGVTSVRVGELCNVVRGRGEMVREFEEM